MHLGGSIFEVADCLAIALLGTKRFETHFPEVKVQRKQVTLTECIAIVLKSKDAAKI